MEVAHGVPVNLVPVTPETNSILRIDVGRGGEVNPQAYLSGVPFRGPGFKRSVGLHTPRARPDHDGLRPVPTGGVCAPGDDLGSVNLYGVSEGQHVAS